MNDDQRSTILEIEARTPDPFGALTTIEAMYRAYTEKGRWLVHSRFQSPSHQCLKIDAPYRHFKYETGLHRVTQVMPHDPRPYITHVSVVALPELTFEDVGVNEADFHHMNVFLFAGDKNVVDPRRQGVALRYKETLASILLRDDKGAVRDEVTALQLLLHAIRGSYFRPSKLLTDCVRKYDFVQNRLIDLRRPSCILDLSPIIKGDLQIIYDLLNSPS